jgi:AcrR family transcriptional regulator
MAGDSRASMVRSAASLIGARGVSATSFADVVSDSGAPRGSIYHHFPEGKRQLAEEAIGLTSERVLAYVRALPTDSPATVLERFVDLWRGVVAASAGRAGCAVAGVAVDTDDDVHLMAVVRSAFDSWVEALADRLARSGLPADRAVPVARLSLAAMEGALILCRAEGSTGPLDSVAGELLGLVAGRGPSA